MGDSKVVRGFISTASLDKHTNLGGGGIVFQGGNHQTTGQFSDLRRKTDATFLRTFSRKRRQDHNISERLSLVSISKHISDMFLLLFIH